MTTCLDPDVLESRSYDGELAFGAYQEFAKAGTEKTRLRAWDATIPLIPVRYHRAKFRRNAPNKNRAEADELYSAMGWKVWHDLPNIRALKTFEGPRHYTGFMHGVIRFGFQKGVEDMNRGFVRAIEPDDMHQYMGRYDRSFTDLDNRLYLEELPRIIEKWMMHECEGRFDDRFKRAVRFCLRLQLRGQRPLPMVVRDVWHVRDAAFVWDWTKVKRRQFLSRHDDIFYSATHEDFLDHVFAQ